MEPKPFNLEKFLADLLKMGDLDLKPIENPASPSHYDMAIQPIEFITANKLDFLEGNVVKYLCRYKRKGGVDDLAKAKDYLERLIERETLG